MNKSVCFVIMPFGRKPDADGREIDFDAIYSEILEPAIGEVGFDAVRADDELSGGVIHSACSRGLCSANTPSPISRS